MVLYLCSLHISAAVLVFRGRQSRHALESAAEICNVPVAHKLRHLINLIPAVPQQLHGLVDAVLGQIRDHGVAGLFFENVTQVPLADTQRPGNGSDADVRVPVVPSDVAHGLEHILALVPLDRNMVSG